MKVNKDLMKLRRRLNDYYWVKFKEINCLDKKEKL
jgi:hypothetical protein